VCVAGIAPPFGDRRWGQRPPRPGCASRGSQRRRVLPRHQPDAGAFRPLDGLRRLTRRHLRPGRLRPVLTNGHQGQRGEPHGRPARPRGQPDPERGLGSYRTFTGSLSGEGPGSTLTLTITQAGGALGDTALTYAPAQDYNDAVAALGGQTQQRATQAAQDQQQLEQQQKVTQALSRAADALTSDLSTLADDAKALGADDLTFRSGLSETAAALAQARSDFATGQHDYDARPQDCGQVSTDAGTVSTDEGTAETGQGSVDSETTAVRDDADRLEADLRTAIADAATLAQAQNQAGDRGTAVQPADVDEAKRSVPKQLATARAAAARADVAATALVNAAKRVSAQADQLDSKCTS